jgi:hypothetical protein
VRRRNEGTRGEDRERIGREIGPIGGLGAKEGTKKEICHESHLCEKARRVRCPRYD